MKVSYCKDLLMGKGTLPILIVAWREMTSGERGCNLVTSNLLKSCSIKPFRDILPVSLKIPLSLLSVLPLVMFKPVKLNGQQYST